MKPNIMKFSEMKYMIIYIYVYIYIYMCNFISLKVIKPLLGMVTMDVYGLLPHENEGIGYRLDG